MGWASGSYVMDDIISSVKKAFPLDADLRQTIYHITIQALEGADWDTQDECQGQDSAFDKALAELRP